MPKPTTIWFVAGKSGGHIIPALTKANNICKKNKYTRIGFFTTNSAIDKKILDNYKNSYDWVTINLENIPGKRITGYPLFFLHVVLSFFKTIFHLIKTRPEKIISFGGYVSIPVCFAAFFLRIPVELFELNVVPGKAIKLLSKIATKVQICFEQAERYLPKKKCHLAEYPIRFSHQVDKEAYPLQKYNFDPAKCTILILGGSQGSIQINSLVKDWLIKYSQLYTNIQIIHQTGANDTTDWNSFYKTITTPTIVFDFTDNIEPYYQSANIVICRSGAGTLFETVFFQKKCITIPLETATTCHQVDNAKEISKLYPHLVTVVQQKEIDQNKDIFFKTLDSYISKYQETHS